MSARTLVQSDATNIIPCLGLVTYTTVAVSWRPPSCWAVDAERGDLVARAKVGCGSVKKGQVGGAWPGRGDVPVVQVVDLVSCPLWCKTGVLVQTVQPVEFHSCSS